MARASVYTDSKLQVLERIDAALRRHAKVPTVRELAKHFEVATATMHSWLSKMGEEGLITWEARTHRSLRITPQGNAALEQAKQTT